MSWCEKIQTERCLQEDKGLYCLTTKQSFDSDIHYCNTSCHKIDEGIGESVLLKPSGTVVIAVTESEGNDLEIDIQKLRKTVAVHQPLSLCFGLLLVYHGLGHGD